MNRHNSQNNSSPTAPQVLERSVVYKYVEPVKIDVRPNLGLTVFTTKLKLFEEKIISKSKWSNIGKFKITNYTLSPTECSKTPDNEWYGFTASGRKVAENLTIATDWNVLPKDTIVYIEGIGRRRVDDSGNMVKGKQIDVYIGDPVKQPNIREVAFNFGVKQRNVWILNKEVRNE